MLWLGKVNLDIRYTKALRTREDDEARFIEKAVHFFMDAVDDLKRPRSTFLLKLATAPGNPAEYVRYVLRKLSQKDPKRYATVAAVGAPETKTWWQRLTSALAALIGKPRLPPNGRTLVMDAVIIGLTPEGISVNPKRWGRKRRRSPASRQ